MLDVVCDAITYLYESGLSRDPHDNVLAQIDHGHLLHSYEEVGILMSEVIS